MISNLNRTASDCMERFHSGNSLMSAKCNVHRVQVWKAYGRKHPRNEGYFLRDMMHWNTHSKEAVRDCESSMELLSLKIMEWFRGAIETQLRLSWGTIASPTEGGAIFSPSLET